MAIKQAAPNTVIHVSSLAAVLNSQAVQFFQKLGAARVIFPRYTGLANLRQVITAAGKGVEYEVFILNDGCLFEEGYCHASHTFGGAYCSPSRGYRLVQTAEAVRNRESFESHLADYRRWIWYVGRNCGGSVDRNGFPNGMCGICALPELRDLGVVSLKIIGREGSLGKKIASVKLVRKVLDLVEAGAGPEEVGNAARAIRGIPELCNSGYMCYFR
jgi:collagenase-like PrtC family protease